ncbi:hypothetical protein AMECASPLE_029764 [Ameca splendens]|uniref:Uncharacterized protein n=1 Tax=Ameca splendens TaxID=208324 RepID=A0ABV0Y5Q3_9TELE
MEIVSSCTKSQQINLKFIGIGDMGFATLGSGAKGGGIPAPSAVLFLGGLEIWVLPCGGSACCGLFSSLPLLLAGVGGFRAGSLVTWGLLWLLMGWLPVCWVGSATPPPLDWQVANGCGGLGLVSWGCGGNTRAIITSFFYCSIILWHFGLRSTGQYLTDSKLLG